MVLHTGSKPDQPVFRTAWMDAKKLSEGDVRRMVMRPQVTPCSEGKLLAIFMPPNGPIHVSNWSRMWWHCRGTAVVAFECDTFSSPDFDGYCQANCICGCRFGKRASRSGHTYRTGRVFMHSSCRNALCKGTWYAIAPMVSQLQ